MVPDRDIELAVVGAGPQALTLLCYLAEFRPHTLRRTVVFDPSPWLTQWHRQFAAYNIPLLRSACVHHPHPEPYRLIRYARQHRRVAEMHDPIGRPSTELFADYCQHLIDTHGFEGHRCPERISDLRPLGGGGATLRTGTTEWQAERVVLATNPVRSTVPSWLGEARSRHRSQPGLLHSSDWTAHDSEPDRPAIVIGGGLTGAQIVAAHARAGVPTTWVTRAPLRVRSLDVEATWLGPRLREFHDVADPRARIGIARRARGGGSIPAAESHEMQDLIDQGSVRHLNGTVDAVRPHARHGWQVDLRHQGRKVAVQGGQVICATGSQTHVRHEPLLRRVRAEYPCHRPTGLPVLDRELAWPGTSVHLMGALALTGLGPACRTIIGGRMAAERIVGALGAPDPPRQYPWP